MTAGWGRVITAMATPFDDSGKLDEPGAERLVRHLVENASEAVVVSGTTGESPTLSDDEKLALVEIAVKASEGKAKVLAGTSTYDTAHSVKLTERACQAGADGILAVTPYYNRPGQAGLLAHFRAIADASTVPVMLYNIPSRTGRRIEIETLAKLAEHPRIVAVKDACGDISFTSQTKAALGDGLAIYSGDDAMTLPMLAVGAEGVVSVASHLAGRAISEMIESYLSGNVERARSLHFELWSLFQVLFVEPNPIPLKAALSLCGLPAGRPRLPLTPATEATVSEIRAVLHKVKQLLDAEPKQ
jgi:4-hydroxy-tetrahydrodipicolinate synthase